MHDRVVVITGATGGLGSAVTSAFLAAGAGVAGVARQARSLDYPAYYPIAAELATAEGASAAIAAAIGRFGKVDVLVHLVGGFAGGQTVDQTSDADFDNMIALNLRSAFVMARAALPHLRAARGRLIAIGSRAAMDASPMAGVYSASKAALVALVRAIAAENGVHGVTANVILPGAMDTPANRAAMPEADFSRWVPPASVADLAVWLCTPAAAAVNGAALPVYGGEA